MQRVYTIGTVVTWLAQSRTQSTFMKVLFGAPCLQGSVESSLRQGKVRRDYFDGGAIPTNGIKIVAALCTKKTVVNFL